MNAQVNIAKRSFRAVAMNFSEHGLFLQTSNLFRVQTPLSITLTLAGGKTVTLSGRVASARNDAPMGMGARQGGIGVEIVAPPEDYLQFIKEHQT